MTPGPVHQPGRRRWSTHSTDPTSPGAPPHFLSAFHSVRRPALASRTCGRYRGRPPGDPGASKAEESNPKRPPQTSAARQRTAAQRQPGRRTRGSAEIRVRHVLPEPSPPPRAPARRRPLPRVGPLRSCASPPGTDVPKVTLAWTEYHHTIPWECGGETKLGNLVMLCRAHHRQIHFTEWIVRIRDGLPEFIPPKWIEFEQRPRRRALPHLAAAGA
jgi:hypothetical protein